MEKEKILIVNGDKYVRQTLQECLESDYEVYTSSSFTKALHMYKNEQFNTVVTELVNDNEKGIEVITKFQAVKSPSGEQGVRKRLLVALDLPSRAPRNAGSPCEVAA